MKSLSSKLWLIVICLLPLLFFTTPKTAENQCIKHVSLGSQVLFLHNCDTHSIGSAALNFYGYVFEDDKNPWRGRPLYIAIGAVGAPVLSPIAIIVNKYLNKKLNIDISKKKYLHKYPIYLSYVIFQLLCLIGICTYSFRLIGVDLTNIEKNLIAALIVSADLVQSWFWQHHSIFFGITIPIISVFAFQIGYMATIYTKNQIISKCVFLGMGVLIYQMSILWLPMFICGMYFSRLKKNSIHWSKLYIGSVAFIAPLALWYAFNKSIGMPYAYEANVVKQFVWILDAINDNNLIQTTQTKLNGFYGNLLNSVGREWIAPTLVLLFGLWHKTTRGELKKLIVHPIFVACILAILSQLTFNFFQGYYQPRLINPILLLFSLLALWLVGKTSRHNFKYAVLFLVVVQIFSAYTSPPLTMT